MLKTPTLPSKKLKMTSKLDGRAYVAAGQADGALHTVAVLQTYKANLLKGQGLSPEAVTELHYTIDLSL